jgi:hypothetical protein
MDEFKEVLSNKNIQKAYQLIFDLFSDLKKKNSKMGIIKRFLMPHYITAILI